MDKSDAAKYKAKKYFMRQNKQNSKHKLSLEYKLKGFLCSCNNREKDCIKEAYNILNEYADRLYPSAHESKAVTAEDREEDISDSLTKELFNMKQSNKPDKKRFQVIESGAKNFLFIKTTLENPVELAETIVKDILESGKQKTKFLLRLIPIETTCKANIDDICNAFMQIAEKHFKDSAQTYSVMFNHRNNNVVDRDEVIKRIAGKVSEIRSDHKVDLKNGKLTVIVEVIKGFAFLSIISDYFKYKKYNLLSISNQEQTTNT